MLFGWKNDRDPL